MGCDTGQEGKGGGGRQLVKERAVLWDVTDCLRAHTAFKIKFKNTLLSVKIITIKKEIFFAHTSSAIK